MAATGALFRDEMEFFRLANGLRRAVLAGFPDRFGGLSGSAPLPAPASTPASTWSIESLLLSPSSTLSESLLEANAVMRLMLGLLGVFGEKSRAEFAVELLPDHECSIASSVLRSSMSAGSSPGGKKGERA